MKLSIECWDNLKDLQSVWEKEFTPVSPFQTFIWNKLWLKHFGQNIQLKIYLAKKEDQILALIPWYETNTQLQFLGTPPNISDYQDVIWNTDNLELKQETLRQLFVRPELKEKTVSLTHLPEISDTRRIVKQMFPNHKETSETTPYLPITKTWEDYLFSLSKKNRHELKRKFRRLGEKSYEIQHFTKESDISANLKTFIELHKKSAPDKDTFMNEPMQEFFVDFTKTFAKNNTVLLSTLTLENQVVAATISFMYNSKVWLYNSGYNPDFRDLSVGLLLIASDIKYGIENGYQEFDFLRGDERYKYDLGGQNRYIYNVEFQN